MFVVLHDPHGIDTYQQYVPFAICLSAAALICLLFCAVLKNLPCAVRTLSSFVIPLASCKSMYIPHVLNNSGVTLFGGDGIGLFFEFSFRCSSRYSQAFIHQHGACACSKFNSTITTNWA